jgi:hypothetical protein
MAESNQDTLIVKKINPGYGITTTHARILTDELATCYAVGGFTSGKTPAVFMTHLPDYDHSNHVMTLAEKLELRKREGRMVLFAADPSMIGCFTSIDGGRGYPYADAIDIFMKRLRGEFPGFRISHLLYGGRNKGPYSHAEIDLTARTASTNSGTRNLDRFS